MNKRTRYGVAVVSLLLVASLVAVGCQRGGELQTMGTSHITSDVHFGVDGTGVDVTWYSGTASDYMQWDASEEGLTIVGTDGQAALTISDGNLSVTDNLSVDGTVDLDDLDMDGNQLDLDADDDTSLTADTDDQIDIEVGGADIFTLKDWGADSITSSTTKHLLEIADATNVMTGGTNSLAALNIDMGIGDSTGGTNSVYGILIDTITGDAQNTETAISVGTGWDTAADFGGDVVLENDEVIDNGSDGTVAITDGTNTLMSVVDAGTTGNVNVTGALDVQGGDITLQNDETVSNSNNGVVQIGGFLAFTEGSVIAVTAASTITPLGSFQPLTSTSVITNAVIADGSVAGQVVLLTNENASDNITILEAGSNLAAGGNIQLDGGNDDCVMLLWTGDEWIKVAAFGDN